ncbi:DMT family transporter [uncultured Ramlibacter sp.]|uniref:DMT family transporter n=1 Tax=uncultured Ramlibacter sp. TaxID=260755 RepID=UPI00262F6DA0|nr:DMT family transporter [uncultured Ramlibacter sp.]
MGAPALAALALMFNAFVWGVSWWPFRDLQERGLHPLWSTALIYLFSLACLLLARPRAWQGFTRNPLLWLLVAAAGMTNVGFNWAVTVGDVVRVVLLFYLMPAWSVLLAWPLLGEKPTAARLARLALALAGVAVVLKTPGTPWPLPESLADWLALLGGASFALTNILLRKLGDVPAPTRILGMFGGGALLALAAGALGMAQGTVTAPVNLPPAGLAVAMALALCFLLGNIALQYGAARLPAHTTSLVMLSEVVFASVSSVALAAAELSARTLAGGALILAAAAWSAWPGAKSQPA